jgi:hypothetical protein
MAELHIPHSRTDLKDCSWSQTYQITIKDGCLVLDEQARFLFNAGFQVIPVNKSNDN